MAVSPALIAIAAIVNALASPFIAWAVSSFRWWWTAVACEVLFATTGIWLISHAVDTESAKNIDNLGLLLSYAIDFWIIVFGALMFALAFAIKGIALSKRTRTAANRPQRSP